MTDTGGADPRLAAALESGDRAAVLAALVDARVFATITATATAEEAAAATGLRAESSAEMAVVLLEAPDGARALPVFSDLAALKRWRLDGRPVPLTGAEACAAALDEGAEAVVVDPAGAAVTVHELSALAAGWVPVEGSSLQSRTGEAELVAPTGPAPAALVSALRSALAPERLRSARLLQGPDGWVLGVAGRAPLDPAALAALAHRVLGRLGPALPAEGLDLAQVAPRGPGEELLRRGLLRRGR
ncbi:MAG: SseB family protein [Mycobacteriales bacterium]